MSAALDIIDVRGASRARVAVQLFGPFKVVRSGDATLAPSRKVRALIAYLVMAPRPIHRAKLCELLWDVPDDPVAARCARALPKSGASSTSLTIGA